MSGDFTLGNKSLVIPENNGISKAKNLAMLTSFMAFKIKDD